MAPSIQNKDLKSKERAETLPEIFQVYRRHIGLFLLIGGGVFIVAAAYTFLQTPKYTATTEIVVTGRGPEVGSDPGSANNAVTDAKVDTEVEMLKSRAIAAEVVRELGSRRSRADTRESETERGPEATESLMSNIRVRRAAQSHVLTVSFTSPARVEASRVANAYADAYIRQSQGLKLRGERSANGLLGAQVQMLRGQVEAAEAAVGRYRTAHGLLNVQGSTVTEQEITALDQQVAEAKAAGAEHAARLSTAREQLAGGSAGDDVGEALESPVVQELRRQRAEVSRRLADLEGRFGPRYPEVVDTQRQLNDTDLQIRNEIARTVSNLTAQHRIAAERTASLQSSMAHAQGALAGAAAASVRLNELERTAQSERGLYEDVLKRWTETQTQAATIQADAQISSYSVPPRLPSSPNIPVNLLLGALLAVGSAVGAVIIRDGFDSGIGSMEEVEARLGVPFLGGLPTVASSIGGACAYGPAQAIEMHSDSSFAEAFHGLGATMLRASLSSTVRTVAITSSLPKEGKTTTAICLAKSLAMEGKRVVLVDCDVRRPAVAATLGLTPEVGLLDVLADEAWLEQALIIDEATGLHILPAHRGAASQWSLLRSPAMDRLLERLRGMFDYVILDLPPVLPVMDGRLLARKADAVALMILWRKTPEQAVRLALQMLRSMGVDVAGASLSKVDLKAQARSSFGDPGRYYGLYKDYYGTQVSKVLPRLE
jgi:succinoglycan biosynthesis transport protein ExoP